MAHAPYYSPRLDRPLITALYHAAKAKRIPMTRLASSLVRDGLERLAEGHCGESPIVRENIKPSLHPAKK